jgi:hypothetical protein
MRVLLSAIGLLWHPSSGSGELLMREPEVE